jgi:hypothetical protein
MYQIEDTPRHEALQPGNPKGGRRPIYPFAALLVGQSFLVPPDKERAARVSASYFKSKNSGWDCTCERSKIGLRIYRLA